VTLAAFSNILGKKKNTTSSAHATSDASHSSASSVSATASSVSSSALHSSPADASSAAPTASGSLSRIVSLSRVGSSGLSGSAIGGITAACILVGLVLFSFIGGMIYRRRVRKQEEVELKNRFSDTIPFSANLRYPYFDQVSHGEEVPSARLQDDSDAAIKKHDVMRVPVAHLKPTSPEL